jgi:Mycothiol maleylpyruvate isomerase N-terminal domain
MPISPTLATSNRSQTDRLRALVATLDEAAFETRLSNGWTVSGILAHIAFWDRQRLCLMRSWAAGNWCSGSYDGDVFNETMRPLLELIPGSLAAGAAVHAAEEVDAFLLEVSDDVVVQALARPDAPNLDRGSHRGYHLDQIERAFDRTGAA